MAAIAGVLTFADQQDAGGLARTLLRRMAHRSPEGMEYFEDGPVALAHGALLSTPESIYERQPMELGRWVIIVDGRIDDRTSLLRELGIDQADAGRIGDADLFAQAWLRWGVEFWRHVVGDFALAAWDRDGQRLTLVRDRVGVRPLYYIKTAGLLGFASEAEALLGLGGTERAINENRLPYLLGVPLWDGDHGATFYRDIRRVMNGEMLVADARGVALERYWRMQPMSLLRLHDPREYVEAFREVYQEAVHCRLRSLRRPALMLSGGIDSASVLAAARRLHSEGGVQQVLPISVVSDMPQGCEETRNIVTMMGDEGIRLSVPSFSGDVGITELCDAAWNKAHPIDNSVLIPRAVYMAARKHGSNVVLDGIDGDTVMRSSNDYVGRLALSGHPLQALREAGAASIAHTYMRGRSPWSILGRGIAATLQPTWLAVWRRMLERRDEAILGGLLDPAYAVRNRLQHRLLQHSISSVRTGAAHGDQEELINSWWDPGLIRSFDGFDRSAASFGVEARHPWGDLRVLEFFLRMPAEYKVREGWTKHPVRAAYEHDLGRQVAWHSGKAHLGPEVTRCVLGASVEEVRELLDRAASILPLDPVAWGSLRSSWQSPEGRERSAKSDSARILSVTTLTAWANRYALTSIA